MRLLGWFASSLLATTAVAAKLAKDRFETNIAKSQPVKLDDAAYAKLTSAPRDYAVTVLLTAMKPQFGCSMCREFQPEWDMLSKQWTKKDRKKETRLIFATLDFVDGRGTFQALQLQTAPVLLLFNPTTGLNAKTDPQPIRFDFSTGPQSADSIHAWIARHLPDTPTPSFKRPLDYVRIAIVTTTVLGLVTAVSVAAPYVLPIIQNRNLWAAVSLILILLFTSGHMFNHIRKVPYVASDGKGGVSYFAGGFQNQFGLETQIVAALYGILSFAVISLALKVPRMSDAQSQTLAAFVWAGVVFVVYSFLLSVFRVKNGSYPFWLPPF